MTRLTLEQRFWSKVERGGDDDCWVWTGSTSRGYGYLKVDGKNIISSRVSWQLHRGQIPYRLHVLHTCDNPSCVNPKHLFLGTQKDNAMDRNKKGRAAPKTGSLNGRSRFTERGVSVVREMAARGRTHKSIAEFFGVHETTIRLIANGNHWNHLYRKGEHHG